MDVDREGGRELSIELAERRMKTHAVERSFSEALREGKAKRKVQTRKRSSGSQEESIVTRLLKEKAQEKAGDKTGSQSESTPVVKNNDSVQKKQENRSEMLQNDKKLGEGVPSESVKEGRVARERTESECSDTMPDLCPIEQEEEEKRRLEEMRKEMEQMRKPEAVNPEPEKKLRFSEEISKDLDVEKDRELTPIFLTNFDDDESEAEVSSADVTENLTGGINAGTDVVEPQVRSVVEKLFHDIFDQKNANSPEQPARTEISSESIDSFIQSLVSRIIDLVLTLSRNEMQSKTSTTVARGGTFQMTGLETESEDESEMSEISECENVNDMFDLSMKRLNFIENSFKTMSSSTLDLRSITPDVQAITHSKDEAENEESGELDPLQRIRQILAAEGNADEKLKRIGNIVNGGAKNCDSGKKGE